MVPTNSHILSILEMATSTNRDRTFLADETDRRVSYAEFLNRIRSGWGSLRAEGVREGEVVGIILENSPGMIAAICAVLTYGAIAMPINPGLKPAEIGELIDHADARLVIAAGTAPVTRVKQTSLEDFFRGAPLAFPPKSSPENGCLLIYTSGTTGSPKGILLSQRNIISNVSEVIRYFSIDGGHRKACILPLFHLFGLMSDVLPAMFSGGECHLFNNFGPARVREFGHFVKTRQIHSFSAMPLIYELLNSLGFDAPRSQLKFCVSGAGPLRKETAETFVRKNEVMLVPGYGLSETTCYSTINPLDAIRYDSIGKPFRFNEIKIIDENANTLGAGEIGELIIRGENVMRGGYYKNPINCYAFPEKEWFRTGDLGYYDQAGYFYIVGRRKNMIIRGGQKIYLEDIDRCLCRMDAVRECASIKVENGGNEEIATFVVAQGNSVLGMPDVRRFLSERMGGNKHPDHLFQLSEIPRTPTRKVDQKALFRCYSART